VTTDIGTGSAATAAGVGAEVGVWAWAAGSVNASMQASVIGVDLRSNGGMGRFSLIGDADVDDC
jgi:hypothetical protein